MASPAPGWYSDPEMSGTRRYWDGQQWTEHRAPAEANAAAGGPGFWTITRAVALGILVAIACVWVFVQIQSSNDGTDCAIENANRAMDGRPLLDCPGD